MTLLVPRSKPLYAVVAALLLASAVAVPAWTLALLVDSDPSNDLAAGPSGMRLGFQALIIAFIPLFFCTLLTPQAAAPLLRSRLAITPLAIRPPPSHS